MNFKIVVCGAMALLATALLAQTNKRQRESARPPSEAAALRLVPLNVKTGLWQLTRTMTWTGLPPQFAAAMNNGHALQYKSCVKAKDLNSNPWADGSGDICTWKALHSNGTDMELHGRSCQLGKEYGLTAEILGKIHVIDSEDGTGSFDVTLTGNGQTMHGHASYTGKWIGATCPARD